MLKKKQVLAVLSVAVASCLIGTMFSMNIVVMAKEDDGDGSPWDRVWTAISGLESKVETLEGQLPPQGFLTAPGYDSGWTDINPGWHLFEHNLGTTEVVVCLQGRCSDYRRIFNHGQYLWQELNATHITVNPGPDADQIRVMIWRIPEP